MLGFDPLTAGTLLILASSGANVCDLAKQPAINVRKVSKRVVMDTSRSLDDIQDQELDTISPYAFHGETITQGFMEGRIQVKPEIKLQYAQDPRRNVGCLWYDEINVTIELHPTVVIAKEVFADPCMRRAVKDHEMKHVKVDRRLVNKFDRRLERELRRAVRNKGYAAGPFQAERSDEIADRMYALIFETVDHEYKKLELERTEKQRAIDTLEEYERVSAMCPGFRQ